MNLKSLAFYASAIGFVIALFSVTTAYGEANLKASTPIGGEYRIAAQDLPGCLKGEALLLTIQQSGVYLSGSLLSSDAARKIAPAKRTLSLMGTWNQQQLELTGLPSQLEACRQADGQVPTVSIAGTITQNTLQSKVRLNEGASVADFIGKREAGK